MEGGYLLDKILYGGELPLEFWRNKDCHSFIFDKNEWE